VESPAVRPASSDWFSSNTTRFTTRRETILSPFCEPSPGVASPDCTAPLLMNTEGGGVLTIWEEGAGEEGAGCGGVTGSDEVGGGGAKGGSEDEARDAEGDLVGEDWIRAGLGSSGGEAGAISRSEACLAGEVGVCARDVSALWSGIVGEEASSGWAVEAERVAGVGPSGEAPSSPEWG
jgi:hypothetical protein